MKTRLLTIVCLLLCILPAFAGSLVARFQSVLGDFDVLLDPAAAPRSVENFSAYANRGSYDRSIIHRSTTGNPFDIQIIQGGGFSLVANQLVPVPADPPIALEAGLANARGTIAMARTDDPNSATSQWFFNQTDNPGLNTNYAVFGQVLGAGQSVIDTLAAVPVYNASVQLGSIFGQLPLLAPELSVQYLVLINAVRVEPFAITNLARHDHAVEIRWRPLSTNTPVRVERREDLDHGSWTTVSSNNTTGIFRDTNVPTSAVFYRLATE